MISIQLFGITESKSLTNWNELVSQALAHLELDYEIEVVSDLDQFIKYGLTGIPALVVAEEVVFQKEVPELAVLVKVLRLKIEDAEASENLA